VAAVVALAHEAARRRSGALPRHRQNLAFSRAPLDDETILDSVRKTKLCIVADYDWVFCGFGAELAARIQETCFAWLDAPVKRLASLDTPCPASPVPVSFLVRCIAITNVRPAKHPPASSSGQARACARLWCHSPA